MREIARAQQLFEPPSPTNGSVQVDEDAELGFDVLVECKALLAYGSSGSSGWEVLGLPVRVEQVGDEAPVQDDGDGDEGAVG